MSFSSETWIQVYKANAKDGFVINEITFFFPEGNHLFS